MLLVQKEVFLGGLGAVDCLHRAGQPEGRGAVVGLDRSSIGQPGPSLPNNRAAGLPANFSGVIDLH